MSQPTRKQQAKRNQAQPPFEAARDEQRGRCDKNNDKNNDDKDNSHHEEDRGDWGAPGQFGPVEDFDDGELGLKHELLRGIYAHGFERPSPIQARAIKPLVAGRDVIAQAQSGSGKTGAFAIGCLQRVDHASPHTQAIVLAPTRELAQQSADVVSALGEFLGTRALAVVGGTSISQMASELRKGVHVVVGTPGRVFDMVTRRELGVDGLRLLVVDEADQMLGTNFVEQVHAIFRFLPEDVQVGLFSATMPPDVLQLARKLMRDPVRILVKKEQLTLQGIDEYFVDCGDGGRGDSLQAKLGVLEDLYDTISVAQSVIFANSRRTIAWLADELAARDFTVSCLHGDLDMRQRRQVMKEFKCGSSRVLLATDIVARGIDVQGVSLIINVELPRDNENYLHRIGRSGRFGRKGVAINLVAHPRELGRLRELEAFFATHIRPLPENVDHVVPS